MKTIKCSFDFDGTLDSKTVQKYARELIEKGIEIWIVTSRRDCEHYIDYHKTNLHDGELVNKDLFEIAEQLGIPNERIHFTNFEFKYLFLKDKDFIWHLDDSLEEIKLIYSHTKVKPISYFYNPNWKGKCEKILKQYS